MKLHTEALRDWRVWAIVGVVGAWWLYTKGKVAAYEEITAPTQPQPPQTQTPLQAVNQAMQQMQASQSGV